MASPRGFEGKNKGLRQSTPAATDAKAPDRTRPTPDVDGTGAEKVRPVSDRSVGDIRAALVVAAASGNADEIRRLLGELERAEGVARRLRLVR